MSLINKLKNDVGPSKDYKFKELIIDKCDVLLIFNEVLTDGQDINDFVLRKLLLLNKRQLNKLDNVLPNTNITNIKESEILNFVNNGYLVIVCKRRIYASEFKNVLERGITTIESELSITGPKDSFSENFNTNLGLIRRRIKSSDLYVEDFTIGRSSKTKTGVLYMNNIVKKQLPKEVIKKLKKIDIDAIIDSSYLKKILEGKKSVFPTIMMSERPDKSAMALLEGKIVILVDMSSYALILPSFLIDFFHTSDDYYQKSFNVSFIRIIRFFAFLIAIFTPAIYIAVTTRNYDLVPYPLLMILKAGRTFVPFPAYIEALFMIICFEILKESDLRMSSTSGSAISILGGLILGDAAVSAGVVSPIMIIIIAISSIAGLIFTSIEFVNALRTYKIGLLFLGTVLGIYGVILGGIYMFYQLLRLKVFGLPYCTPFTPYEANEINDSIIKKDTNVQKRNSLLSNNIIRGRYK